MGGICQSACLLPALLLAACSGDKAAAGARAPAPPTEVRLHTVATAPLPRTIAVTGSLVAQEELVLGMLVGGRLDTLAVDVGDRVEEGALIAALDLRDFELALERTAAASLAAHARLGRGGVGELAGLDIEATAPVLEAQAVVLEAKLQRERIVTMVHEQLRASAELEAADAALAVATSRLQRARDDVRTWLAEAEQRRIEQLQAQKRLADARLVAPWRGRVAARHATAGQVLVAGERIVTLVRVDPLRLQLPVPEQLGPSVALGQTVRFTVDGLPGERSGRIARRGAGVDRSNRTVPVEAEVGNADGALLPGSFCRAHIVVDDGQQVVVVPRSAVVSFAGIDRVFTVETAAGKPARARGHIVQLGRDVGESVEVLRGIEAGARIVVAAQGLGNDAAVAVVE